MELPDADNAQKYRARYYCFYFPDVINIAPWFRENNQIPS